MSELQPVVEPGEVPVLKPEVDVENVDDEIEPSDVPIVQTMVVFQLLMNQQMIHSPRQYVPLRIIWSDAL